MARPMEMKCGETTTPFTHYYSLGHFEDAAVQEEAVPREVPSRMPRKPVVKIGKVGKFYGLFTG